MAAAATRRVIMNKVTDILKAAVDVGVDPTYFVKTWDTYLHDIESDQFPFVVVNARQTDMDGPGEMSGEIGTVPKDLWKWTVHIYYLDIADVFQTGDEKRDIIVERMENAILKAYNLNNLTTVPDGAGRSEYAYDSYFTNILFDSSGQDGYHTFVSELYLNVDTAKR